MVQLVGSELSFHVSFVIADVEHALLGMDILMTEQLSMIRASFNEYYLVNKAGAKTQLQPRGHHLYLEACPEELGLSNCMRSSLPEENGSLLDDKGRTQQEAIQSSGGACGTSFFPEDLRQQQDNNTATLGTTTLPTKGATRRKKKKPSARKASQDHDQRSLEQKGQTPAATQLRNSEKPSLIKKIELAAEEEGKESLSNIEKQELSLRILLTLSLRSKWQITTTRATAACSEDALGQQLRDIGLEQNKLDTNIFSGDELVILVHKSSILIGGPEFQQECFFCELSALVSLEPPTKLDQDTPISFCNKTLEYTESSHSISLRVPTSFYMELLQRHDLEEVEPTTSLQEEELNHQEASEHNIALEADRQELYKQTVGDLVWATTCRPDLSFEVHLLTQSLTTPTRGQEKQLQKVLSYLKGTLHYSLSLHPTNKRTKVKVQSLELLAFSSSSWTEACRTTSTAYLLLWGVPLIASCRTTCAYNQSDAELDSVRLALALASHTKSLLQHLELEQLAKPTNISLKTSSLRTELVTGRPLAMQLGLSRRNKHIKLKGQLPLSKVHPNKNLAHSLTDNASDQRMLAKLRIDTEAAETLALSTVQGPCLASFVPSSSLLVGMVAAKPSQMAKPQLRKPSCFKSVSFVRTCFESLSRNFADSLAKSFQSLTLTSWSLPMDSLTLSSLNRPRGRFHSLTLHSLSLTEGNLQSLTLQSLSLIDENGFQRISLQEVSFEDGSLKETDQSLAHTFLERRAGTNSFSQLSLQEKKPPKEAETNSFFTQSFRDRTLSLSIWLRIFLLCSFQLTCAALLLGTCSFTMSFPTESLQADQLEAAYFRSTFQQQSLQQDELAAAHLHSPTRASQLDSFEQMELCRINLENLIHQLDLETSLSLPWFSLPRCRYQLQSDSFERSSFEHRALPCAALLYNTRISTQLQNRQVESFQLTSQQLSFGLVSGGVHLRAFYQPALQARTLSTALTLISLSLAINAWLKPSSKRAWRKSPLRKSLGTTSLPTTSFRRAASTTAFPTTSFTATSRFRKTLLSVLWFSVLFSIFFSNSFRRQEIVEKDELLQTVLEQA